MAAGNKPEKKIRAGAIAATIWKNEITSDGRTFPVRSVQIDRNFKNKEGQWQSTNSFRDQDIPKAILVLQKAYEFIVLAEESTGDQQSEFKPANEEAVSNNPIY